MGTPEFAVASLDILIENGYNVVGVITATDKLGGRGGKQVIQSAVKKYAVEKGLNILQPKNLKASAFIEELRALKADLQIIVAFRMLPVVVWDMPPMGTFNLHGSLLPKYRGAAPIHWAVINGETRTGVTSFMLKHEIDTGNIMLQEMIAIGEEETTGSVYNRLMKLGAETVLKTVELIEKEEVIMQPQNEALVCKAPKLKTENTEINFNQSAESIRNFIRGLNPYPIAWTTFAGKKLKVFKGKAEVVKHDVAPGEFETDQKKYLRFATADGWIYLEDLQLQGKKRMDINSFLNGFRFEDA
jgi:methionyl-tRNA formyltransferase